MKFLEGLTGIEGLIPDPYFVGGGFHETENGGHLNIHADFNCHKILKLERRINVPIYLNKDWQEEFGGQLELWNSNMSEKVNTVSPVLTELSSLIPLERASTVNRSQYSTLKEFLVDRLHFITIRLHGLTNYEAEQLSSKRDRILVINLIWLFGFLRRSRIFYPSSLSTITKTEKWIANI